MRASDVTTVNGLQITTVARTLVDCLVDLPGQDAFVVGDSLLRVATGYNKHRPDDSIRRVTKIIRDATDILLRLKGRNGTARATKLLALLNPAAESPGESLTRYWLLRSGLPEPELQIRIDDGDHHWFLDMGWQLLKLNIEFDGRGKYGLSESALYQEKRRQDRLTELGWTTVRVSSDDLRQPEQLINRVLPRVPAGIQLSMKARPWMV